MQLLFASKLVCKQANKLSYGDGLLGWSRGHKARGKGQGHKKILGQGQSQGQPIRGQTFSRPRTGMLKTKDTSARVLQKKSLQKFFSGDLKKRSSKTFFRRSPVKYTLLKFFFRRSTKFQQFKKSAVLELRTGQFSRT